MASPKKETAKRIARTEAYAEKVRKEFEETVNEILALNKVMPELDTGVMFSFDGQSQKKQKQVEELLRKLHSVATLAIQEGIELEWATANDECDELLKTTFGERVLTDVKFKAWTQRNDEAREAFMARAEDGLNLSGRVWKSVTQLREEMEVAITVAVGEGTSASNMSRRVRQYLNDPDLMFRRFRYKDENGEWQRKWKKRYKDEKTGKYRWMDYDRDAYKTGRGVYKSAAKNAMRVARTETNIAYRRADHERWQQLDFVRGQRVQLSNRHPAPDICDDLAGDYPKDFVFDGWHPQCFCFVTPIMASEDELAKEFEAFSRGESYTPKGEEVTEYPSAFKKWVKANEGDIKAARKRGTEPYFIRNNASVIDDILNSKAAGNGAVSHTQRTSVIEGTLSSKEAASNKTALLSEYKTVAEVNETFRQINAGLSEKWFEHGDLKLSTTTMETSGLFEGYTTLDGNIYLTPVRLTRVESALGKIGRGEVKDITYDEADAMATFWHEITHNRNIPGRAGLTSMTDIKMAYMELANEYVARHSLREFYSALGVKDIPHLILEKEVPSTGYDRWVRNYDDVISMLGLDANAVYARVREGLFSAPYTRQRLELETALIKGGLTYANGDRVRREDLSKLMQTILDVRAGYTLTAGGGIRHMTREEMLAEWLREYFFLP